MARIKDAALFANGELEDCVEIHERPARQSWNFGNDGYARAGKRNGKRRSFYSPSCYHRETKVQIFLLIMPRRDIIPPRSSF